MQSRFAFKTGDRLADSPIRTFEIVSLAFGPALPATASFRKSTSTLASSCIRRQVKSSRRGREGSAVSAAPTTCAWEVTVAAITLIALAESLELFEDRLAELVMDGNIASGFSISLSGDTLEL